MNDRYLFKAKRIDNGEWVYGCYRTNGMNNHFITVFKKPDGHFTFNEFEIKEETLCQCTSFKDKAGTLIWENDIIKTEDGLYTCIWDNYNLEYSLDRKNESFGLGYSAPYLLEVVGNLLDNPELLEVR